MLSLFICLSWENAQWVIWMAHLCPGKNQQLCLYNGNDFPDDFQLLLCCEGHCDIVHLLIWQCAHCFQLPFHIYSCKTINYSTLYIGILHIATNYTLFHCSRPASNLGNPFVTIWEKFGISIIHLMMKLPYLMDLLGFFQFQYIPKPVKHGFFSVD